MALNASNSNNLEQLALKGLMAVYKYVFIDWLCSDAYQYESYGQAGMDASAYGTYSRYHVTILNKHHCHSVIFVNENENGEKRENNEFVKEN